MHPAICAIFYLILNVVSTIIAFGGVLVLQIDNHCALNSLICQISIETRFIFLSVCATLNYAGICYFLCALERKKNELQFKI